MTATKTRWTFPNHERRRALFAVVMEARIHGVLTRKATTSSPCALFVDVTYVNGRVVSRADVVATVVTGLATGRSSAWRSATASPVSSGRHSSGASESDPSPGLWFRAPEEGGGLGTRYWRLFALNWGASSS